eukprot:1383284-Amorphochlora_amoeboformis.AAC.1
MPRIIRRPQPTVCHEPHQTAHEPCQVHTNTPLSLSPCLSSSTPLPPQRDTDQKARQIDC